MIVETYKLRSETDVDADGRLIVEAQNDPAAFVRLYRRHYDAIFRYCMHRFFDRETAEDVTSEVFLKCVEKFHRFRGSEKQFRSWLYKIAGNATNNHLRKANRHKSFLNASEQQEYRNTDFDESGQKMAVLKKAILSLKPRYQTIIMLRFFENLKLIEIAEVMSCSPGTARSQLSRALAKLRQNLARFRET
jgi:RNA polymerase sigma-70 factor (ECF subfamily)